MKWNKKGIIVPPQPQLSWMSHGAGPSFARVLENNVLEIFVSGRSATNQSHIGIVKYNLETEEIISIAENPLFNLGELGTFDFNGTSYPWIVENGAKTHLYYTGWTKGFHVSFINDLGLYFLQDGCVEKFSRAPLIPRTNAEPYGVGSVCVLKESEEDWKMWYTCFQRWGSESEPDKHFYHIKYAESRDGLIWYRPNVVSVNFDENEGEYVTGKPCVIRYKGKYLMWFSYRGEAYKIGLAVSNDGQTFTRMDNKVGIEGSIENFDDEMICYGQVFFYRDNLCMVYNGNGYGRSGLGLATLPISELDAFIESL